MRDRCNGPGNYHYGGRGIAVDARWDCNFPQFLADMGPRPDGCTLDRIDNDGPYSPENCRWATWDQQHKNRSITVFIEHQGERKTIKEWARDTGIPVGRIKDRYYQGWPPEHILNPSKCKPKRGQKYVSS